MADKAQTSRLLASAMLSAMLAPLNSTMVAVALPTITVALAADSAAVRLGLVTSYLLASIVLQSVGGKLGDRLGYRRTLALGQGVFTFGALLAVMPPSLVTLSLARVIMAAGGAIIVPSATAVLRTELDASVRGRAFGLFGAGMALAAAIGPQLGGVLLQRLGWRAIFFANLPVLMAAATLVQLSGGIKASALPGKPVRFDLLGSLLFASALMSIVLGSQTGGLRLLIGVGVLLLLPFAYWERRAPDPLVDFSLFRVGPFVTSSLLIALHNLAMYGLLFELPQVASRLFGERPREVGGLLLAMMLAMMLSAPLSGRAVDRWGSRVVALTGCSVALVAMLWLRSSPLASLTQAVPALACLGLGFGLSAAPAQTAAVSSVPREKTGMAAGLTATLRYLGGIAGMLALSLLLSDRRERPSVLLEHRQALSVFAVSLALALACALSLPARASREASVHA